ncbi:MAG: 6-phosphogluconate dehydrogenase [Flavobacteriaceae bacterium]|nr:6-phosphogluconate dehydrogenase [Flavobacteriaceae bacterium]
MKKILIKIGVGLVVVLIVYVLFIYFASYSKGYRSGELVKISERGVVFKTWEGTLSQGVSDELQFHFSVEGGDKEVIESLKNSQGKSVKLTYIERYDTLFWLGDTKYYIKEVEEIDEIIEVK